MTRSIRAGGSGIREPTKTRPREKEDESGREGDVLVDVGAWLHEAVPEETLCACAAAAWAPGRQGIKTAR